MCESRFHSWTIFHILSLAEPTRSEHSNGVRVDFFAFSQLKHPAFLRAGPLCLGGRKPARTLHPTARGNAYAHPRALFALRNAKRSISKPSNEGSMPNSS